MNILGQKCDEAISSKDVTKISAAIEDCMKRINATEIGNNIKGVIYYFLGNLYSSLSYIENEDACGWRNNKTPFNAIKATNNFREAINLLSGALLYEAKTNLANELKRFGRFVEGLHLWPSEFHDVGDAKDVTAFHKAWGLWKLSSYIEDSGHADYYRFESYKIFRDLKNRKDQISHPSLKQSIENDKYINDFIEGGNKYYQDFQNLQDISLTEEYEHDEKRYRYWCLNNRLFLNHLNDITVSWVADQDIIQFPSHRTQLQNGPFWYAAFSSIKREFCFSMFLLYEGLNEIHPEYENRKLFLTDTLDYVSYGGATEKIKSSLRISFSLFDSLYGLLNHYFNETPKGENKFNGRNIKSNLGQLDNPYISALYWLACDLTDNDHIPSEKWTAPNPSAKHLRKLRNSLEHGWVRIAECTPPWNNRLDYAEVFSLEQLKNMALELSMLVRSSIIYSILAVKYNETNKQNNNAESIDFSTPMWSGFDK